MSLLAVLMLFLQPTSSSAVLDPGAGTVQPQSGGIPTTPPPKPPSQPY